MKSVFEAWLAPAMIFGMIIAGAASHNPFVTASSDDESDPQQDIKVEVKAAVQEATEKALEAVKDIIEVRLPELPKPPQAVFLEKMPVPPVPPFPPQPVFTQIKRDLPHGAHDIALTISDSHANPKVHEFEKKAKELAAKVREAKQNKKSDEEAKLKEELKSITQKHFEVLEGQRKEQMEALAEKLTALKEQMESRAKNADKIIDRRVKQLLGETDDLDWNASTPGADSMLRTRAIIGNFLGSKDSKPHEGARVIVESADVAKHLEGGIREQVVKQLKAAADQSKAAAEHSKAATTEMRKKIEDRAHGKVEEQQKALRMELEQKLKHLEDLKKQLESVDDKVKGLNIRIEKEKVQ